MSVNELITSGIRFYLKNLVLLKLIRFKNYKGISPKLSFIEYLNSKLFIADGVNVQSNSLNCSSIQKISSNVISVVPIKELFAKKDLISGIFNQQNVIISSSDLKY